MKEQDAKEFTQALKSLLVGLIGQEMSKNGVIGKYQETFQPGIVKAEKEMIEILKRN